MIDIYLQGARQRFIEFGGFVAMETEGLAPAITDWADALLVREEQGLVTLVALVSVAPEGAMKAVRDELAVLADRITRQQKTEVQAVMLIITPERLTREQYERWQAYTVSRGSSRLVPWIVDLTRGALFEHTGPPFGIDPDLVTLAAPEPELLPGCDSAAARAGATEPRIVAPAAPPPRQWVTISLLALIVGIWVAMTVAGGALDATETNTALLETWGGQARPEMWLSGQYWRLFTAAFLHFGIAHLGMNGLALWVLGRLIETVYGPVRMLVIYLVAAVAGSLLSAMAGPPEAIAAGASGAVMGLVGAVVWFRLSSPLGERIPWRPILMTLGANLAFGLALSNFVDNWNHLGGLIGGFLAAAAVGVPEVAGMNWPRFRLGRWWHVAAALLLVAGAGALTAGLVEIPGPGRDLALAVTNLENGRYREAEIGLRQAVQRQDDQPRLHWWLAIALFQQGHCKEARSEWIQVQALAPDASDLEILDKELRRCGS